MCDRVKDPVCGMKIAKEVAVATSEHEGKVYYFCALSCKNRFDADPGKYLRRHL